MLYGFGCIGRLLVRLLIKKAGSGDGLRLRDIVVRCGSDNDLFTRARLPRRDSVHGSFEGTIRTDEEASALTANGVQVQVIYSDNPATIDHTMYGINDALIVDTDKIVSAASCTTNAVTPILKAINDRFGVIHGHVETVHSFTNDQNLIDNFH